MPVINRIADMNAEVSAWRRDFHENPELSYDVYRTAGMIDSNLAVPFETTVLGVLVTVERVDLNRNEQIVAVCRRGRDRPRTSGTASRARPGAA